MASVYNPAKVRARKVGVRVGLSMCALLSLAGCSAESSAVDSSSPNGAEGTAADSDNSRKVRLYLGNQIYVLNDQGKYNSCGVSAVGVFEGSPAAITAGHCGDIGDTVFNSRNYEVGRILTMGINDNSNDIVDWSIILPREDIEINGKNNYFTEGVSTGDSIYFDGHATGPSCGVVQSADERKYAMSSDGVLVGEGSGVFTDAEVNPSDSGSPVIREDGSVVGLVSAKSSGETDDGGTMIMTPLSEVSRSIMEVTGSSFDFGGELVSGLAHSEGGRVKYSC